MIAHPSEGVYGLACDPSNADAISRVLAIKARSADKGFILIASQWTQLERWCATPGSAASERMKASWPGPVTWIVEAAADASPLVTGGRSTVAVRITDHPLSRGLCDACGHALISTSANRSGLPAPRSALGVRVQLGREVDYILAGALGGRDRPTPIRDARTGLSLREG